MTCYTGLMKLRTVLHSSNLCEDELNCELRLIQYECDETVSRAVRVADLCP